MLARVLDERDERRLVEARRVLADLARELARVPAGDADTRTLGASVEQLDDFFLLVVVGEFNSGKSTFVNALLGERLLFEGVTPTTSAIHVLRFGERVAHETSPTGVRVVTAPIDLLRDIHIVDTPGTNAIAREHERLTTDFVPRSDLVLFVTSADRPFTETERAFLETIRAWGKKIVIVLNKIDIFEQASELDEVMAFVRDAGTRLLGVTPDVLPVSARLAWKAKQGEDAHWAASRFGALEQYLHDTLDAPTRFALKLANPLGVGDALAARYLAVAGDRLALLAEDVAALGDVDRQLVVADDDLTRGFELRMTGVENALVELESRGHRYFDDMLRVGRVFDLLNRARVQREFEEQVVADTPQQVERRVSELIDWLVDQDFRRWQAITSRLAARQREHGDRVMGTTDVGSFHADRGRLLESVGRESQRVVETYDRRRESLRIADAARTAVAATAALGAGALGLGAAVTVAATTAAADVTGLIAAGVLAAIGMMVLPARRRRAREEMRRTISDLRARLATALRGEFTSAQAFSRQRLVDGIGPYTRFVRAEQGRWSDVQTTLQGLRARIAALTKST